MRILDESDLLFIAGGAGKRPTAIPALTKTTLPAKSTKGIESATAARNSGGKKPKRG